MRVSSFHCETALYLFQIEVLGPRLRLPFDFQVVAKLVKLVGLFTGKNHGSGA